MVITPRSLAAKIQAKAYENLTLAEVLDAPVAAIAGVSEGDAEKLAAAFNKPDISRTST
jgi:hypothetical protein